MPDLKPLIVGGLAIAVLAAAGTAVAATTVGNGAVPAPSQSDLAQLRPATGTPPPTARPTPQGEAERREADASRTAERRTADALRDTGLEVPTGWDIVDVRLERHDDRAVTVIRHQPDGHRLGGPHASLVLDDSGTILGFTRLAGGAGAELPDEEAAREAALGFLQRVAPDYAAGLSVEWVDQHDEAITLRDGIAHTVSGIKVKLHHDDGRYAWVIVGPDAQILTYERDITWDSNQGRRGTQMWLHDSWIAAHEGTGAQPGPPYALA
ncbi:hypothetical protein [Microlunatus parietis]|uniref:DUF3500 domain-containing protein n=1 Tax=Microlunatus parietis TaxID=682979 RepID=A0A7Y9IEI0_9ACTN|nr:hypothetical protein [Microlunatus parietis]NYE75354.1 hypothetical protein [Microlunatus parietis]